MSEASEGLPEAAKPRVFQHKGRRLFLIKGVPRIVDVDVGKAIGMTRERNVRALIVRQLGNLVVDGPVYCINPETPRLEWHEGSGDQCAGSEAIDPSFIASLKTEGLLDLSKRGVKPTVWFLNLDQMEWNRREVRHEEVGRASSRPVRPQEGLA